MPEHAVTVRERLYVGAWHVLFSLCLLALAVTLVYWHWYPVPLDKATGVQQMFWLLLGIDLILGPLLTITVYKRHRLKWLFNLAVILTIQLAAFGYGLSMIEKGRPVWLVFVVDDFELVSPSDIERSLESRFAEEYRESWLQGPRFVAANYSSDPKVARRQRDDEVFEGISLARRPETYGPLEGRGQDLLRCAKRLSRLSDFNASADVASVLVAYPLAKGYLPLKGNEMDMTVLIDANGLVLGSVDLRPWD